MRNLLRNYRDPLLLLLLVTVLALLLTYWRNERPQSYAVQAVLLVLCAADVLAAVLLWRKCRTKVGAAVRRAIARAGVLLMKALDKWAVVRAFFTGKGQHTLSGKNTTVQFDFAAEKKPPKPPKPPKWKDMQTARRKLGYLYYHLIVRRMKNGMPVRASDTPAELRRRRENSPDEERVFDLYIRFRYDERVSPEETELQRLKENLFGKMK